MVMPLNAEQDLATAEGLIGGARRWGKSSGVSGLYSKASGSKVGLHLRANAPAYSIAAMVAQTAGQAHAYNRLRKGVGPFGGPQEPHGRVRSAIQSGFDLW